MFKRCERGIRVSVDVQTSEGLCLKLDCTPTLDIFLHGKPLLGARIWYETMSFFH